MAGAYCKFCDHRCFVDRVIPSGPQMGWAGHLATCAAGKEHSRSQFGFDADTAINPMTHPRQAGMTIRLAQLRKSQQVAAQAIQGMEVGDEQALLADLVDDAFAVWDYMTSNRVQFGICGSRLTDDSGPWTHHFVCTKEPGHVRYDHDHEDYTRRGAPAAKWRDAVNDDGPIRVP